MRVAFTGVSHWHLPLYLDPLLEIPGVTVVTVADPEAAVAAAVAARLGCAWSTDWAAAVDAAEPDLVIVLGRHVDMPEVCRGLIDRGIPFAVEKPAGVTSAAVRELAQRAAESQVIAAVPFVFRHSGMLETFREVAGDDEGLYFSAKFSAGSIERYRNGSEWMLDRALSGGGCMLNLGVHFFDLARLILGDGLHVEGALMSNALDGLDVEDHGVVLLRGERGSALIETGYIYPGPHLNFDQHFSIRTPDHHLAARDESGLEVMRVGGEPEFRPMPISNVQYYPVFVRDLVERARDGRPSLAGLAELADAFALIEEAYRLSPLPPARTLTPTPTPTPTP